MLLRKSNISIYLLGDVWTLNIHCRIVYFKTWRYGKSISTICGGLQSCQCSPGCLSFRMCFSKVCRQCECYMFLIVQLSMSILYDSMTCGWCLPSLSRWDLPMWSVGWLTYKMWPHITVRTISINLTSHNTNESSSTPTNNKIRYQGLCTYLYIWYFHELGCGQI